MPVESMLRDGLSKAPLRSMLYDMVPRALIDRPKTGFSVPLAEWLRGPLRPWAEERLSAASMAGSPLHAQTVRLTWARLLKGNDAYASAVWGALMFESWRARWSA
jgi:asparagine synthase (glutamine-hydrolysing)